MKIFCPIIEKNVILRMNVDSVLNIWKIRNKSGLKKISGVRILHVFRSALFPYGPLMLQEQCLG